MKDGWRSRRSLGARNELDDQAIDADEGFMRRCFDLAVESARRGDFPFAAIVAKNGEAVAFSTNRAFEQKDVTRHAELVALSLAQQALGSTSLDDCTLYANVEPCAACSYAIREARVGRVVFGLASPVMGGFSRWNILGDEGLSARIPEAFAPPPRMRAGFLAEEAEAALRRAAPAMWAITVSRGLFRRDADGARIEAAHRASQARGGYRELLMRFLRASVFDRFGRG